MAHTWTVTYKGHEVTLTYDNDLCNIWGVEGAPKIVGIDTESLEALPPDAIAFLLWYAREEGPNRAKLYWAEREAEEEREREKDRHERYERNTQYRKVREQVYERDNGHCRYCGNALEPKGFCVDHVLPQSRGGAADLGNLVLACRSCNSKKRDRTPEEAGMELLST